MATRISAFLLLSCSAAFAGDAQAEPPAEAQKALAALKEWRAVLHSVSLTFEMAEPSGSKRILEWDWGEEGSIRETRYFTGTAEKPGSRSGTLIIRDRLYSMHYPEGESDYWRPDSVTLGTAPRAGSSSIVAPLYGLWNARESGWLPAVLTAETEWLGETNGRVTVLATPRLRLELDPEHAYLPVDAASIPGGMFHNVVQEFETVKPGVPFPKRGVFTQTFKEPVDGATRHEQPWEIISIRINDPATADNFKLPIPSGTEVLDQLGETLYVQGLGLNHRQAEVGPRVAPPPRPSVWNRTTALLAALGVLLAIGGIGWLRRQAA